jgi:hypothetical protein
MLMSGREHRVAPQQGGCFTKVQPVDLFDAENVSDGPDCRSERHNRPMKDRIVFLVPGFFGFTTVGSVSYFRDVEEALQRGLKRRRLDALIVRCATQPTASIVRRADRLRRQVIDAGGLEAQELHFVGHSTGGLDVRMLLTPGVKIAKGDTEVRIGNLTRTAISVTTPHHGTPLANHFLTLQGHTLLLMLTAMATTGQGRGLITAASKAVSVAASLDDWLGGNEGPLDRIAEGLLKNIRFDRRDPVWRYLDEIKADQGAVIQLTPEGIDLFDASVADRENVDYGCVVAGVPKPEEHFKLKALLAPDMLVLRALFRLLHGLTARPHPRYPYPKPTQAEKNRLKQGLGFVASSRTNDGLVPTLSQLHGRVLHVARADHLDVVGHYTAAGKGTGNWLPSGAGFTREKFDAVWDDVAAAIARGRQPARAG